MNKNEERLIQQVEIILALHISLLIKHSCINPALFLNEYDFLLGRMLDNNLSQETTDLAKKIHGRVLTLYTSIEMK